MGQSTSKSRLPYGTSMLALMNYQTWSILKSADPRRLKEIYEKVMKKSNITPLPELKSVNMIPPPELTSLSYEDWDRQIGEHLNPDKLHLSSSNIADQETYMTCIINRCVYYMCQH